MVQRSSSIVIKSETLLEYSFRGVFQTGFEERITTEKADLLFASTPFKLLHVSIEKSTSRCTITTRTFMTSLAQLVSSLILRGQFWAFVAKFEDCFRMLHRCGGIGIDYTEEDY